MPVTQLDPTTALIVIDLQKGVLGIPSVHPISGVVHNARLLLDAFRQQGKPVVLVTVAGAPSGRTQIVRASGAQRPDGWDELAPELGQQPSDLRVIKRTSGAFTGTDLHARLIQLGVTQTVIIGVATSNGVESTVRAARDLGYNVTVATDAVTDSSAELHENSISGIFPRFAETGSTREILDLLAPSAA